jgi:glycosyltransferase involved in cell wall biosynthesis
MPAVSVIMPAFNVGPYIGASIESVLAQTFTDWELVIVDDGSTDDTYAIGEGHAAADPRIRIIRQANGGISVARNTALRLASGEFFAILDSDDLWSPGFLAAQMAIFAAHPEVDIVTGNAWFLGGQSDGQPARPSPDPRPLSDLASLLADETSVFIMTVFRRKVYETIGGFDESMRCNEDYDLWLRAAVAGFRFYRNDVPLGHYRRRDDSLSAAELKMLRGILRVYLKLRPAILDRPADLAVLDAQVARFDTERLRVEAREALEHRDFAALGDHLAALHRRRGGATLGVMRLMARWAPGILSMAYHMRRARQVAQ